MSTKRFRIAFSFAGEKRDFVAQVAALLASIGSGSEELILEKLDQNAALATLADLARRHPLLARTSEAERIALYTQTASKPLLLPWVAGQLGRGSCRTFTRAHLPAHLPAGQ